MNNLALSSSQRSKLNKVEDKEFRVGIYVRNSDEKQDKEEGTIKNQRLRLSEWVDTRNKNKFDQFYGEVAEIYEDRSLSAKDMNRPMLKKLLRDVQKGKINLILVNELSRISRNTKDFNEIWHFLKQHDCKFVSLREDFDTSSAAGEMMLLMIANFAQFERRQTQERVSLSHLSRAKRGLFCGGRVPMGYSIIEDRPGYLEIVQEEAIIVKKAFEAYLKRETLSSAAKLLNGDGDDSKAIKIVKSVRGGGRFARYAYWNVSSLQNVLRNSSYAGLRTYIDNGEAKQVKAVWKPIIDKRSFNRVQKLLDKNHSKKKPITENSVWPYLLSGITHCQTCSDVMCGKSAHGRSKKYPYYEHSWASKRGSTHIKELYKCDPHRVPAKLVEDAVVREIENLFKDRKLAATIALTANSIHKKQMEKSEVRELKRKIAGFKSRIDGLVERISDLPPDISADSFYDKMRKLKADQNKAEQDLESALKSNSSSEEEPVNLDDYRSYLKLINTVFGEFSTIKPELKEKIIKRLVHKVEVGVDSVRIHFFAGEDSILEGIRSIQDSVQVSYNKGFSKDNYNFESDKNLIVKGCENLSKKNLNKGSQTLTIGARRGT